MAIERFDNLTGARLRRSNTIDTDVEQIYRMQPVLVEHTTIAGVNTIRHGLGRVPVGMKIVNMDVPSGTGAPCHWYRETGDTAWTNAELSARFSVTASRLLLEVW